MEKKKKIMLGMFCLSIICVILYLLLIPHTETVQHLVNNVEDVTITTHPLTLKSMLIEALKIFCIINIPNVFMLIKMGSKKLFNPDNIS